MTEAAAVDLHAHTSASDGSNDATTLVELPRGPDWRCLR
jgi:predicted metal-dependent phosphoesterase TrpH